MLSFLLLVQVMAPRFVAPRPVEAAEAHPVHGLDSKVQVDDGRRKRAAAVVVALDCENRLTLGQPRRFKNHEVGHIADGDHEVSGVCGQFVPHAVVIGQYEKIHSTNLRRRL